MRRHFLTAAALAALVLPRSAPAADATPIDYNRDIKPILSNACYACHGPDEGKRKAGLRLDDRASTLKKAVKVGDPATSALIQRVTTADVEELMPPPKSKKPPLTKAQIDLLRRWVEQGAKFDQHWAFVPPARPVVPTAAEPAWRRNPVDGFVAAGHDRQGVRPAPEADRRTLIRRLSFDLTGLPPTPEEVDAFVADVRPNAHERVVDRLLESKHYGERMAMYWLDLVRYADTGGYHSDNHRDVWLYRDYVIRAFNDNLPFDRFTTEQLAGDLLPNASREQRIASGYNRLLMTTEEGGAQPKEYAAKYSADRVRNVSAVWLAATMGCAECHNHKFDPYTMKDFYSLAGFFADVQEKAVGRQDQTPLPSVEQETELKRLEAEIAEAQRELAKPVAGLEAAQTGWEQKLTLPELRKLPKPVQDALLAEPGKRNDAQKQAAAGLYRTVAPLLEAARKKVADLQARRAERAKAIPTTLVAMTGQPRMVRVLPRGNWLDDSGEVVSPNTPAFLASSGESKVRRTRRDLAAWLVARDNPLTARVFVNRLWKLAFGQGIVRSVDDFGTQGTVPTHPELLDWLAVEFVDKGWDVKYLVRLLVTSAAYRQSSQAPAELRERDPQNLWLARQARYRLEAESIRDNALAVSGLLVRSVGGPPAKPYQPAGYWALLNFPRREWEKDHGDGLYRRGLYTYWCRTFPHPSLVAFDAPSREECTAERPRSNTPLQALVLLNDPSYVEAARALAERIVREGSGDAASRVQFAVRTVLTRPARPEEVKVLTGLYEGHRKQYEADPKAASALLTVGDRPAPKEANATELAAWTSVTRVLLNLHEAVTRN